MHFYSFVFVCLVWFLAEHKNIQHFKDNIHCVLACIIAINDLSSLSILLLLKRYYNIFLWLLLTFFPQSLVFSSIIMMCLYAVLFVFILLWNLGTSWTCCFIFFFHLDKFMTLIFQVFLFFLVFIHILSLFPSLPLPSFPHSPPLSSFYNSNYTCYTFYWHLICL